MSSNEFSIFLKSNHNNTCESTDDTVDSNSKMTYSNNGIDETFNQLIESVFHFTLIPILDKEYEFPVIYLPDLFEILKTKVYSGEELKILEQAIFERTLLTDPKVYLLKTKYKVSITSHTTQKDCLLYLFKCFVELNVAKQENRYPSISEDVYTNIFGFICTNVSTALKQPDLYLPQNVHEQVIKVYL